MISAPYKPVANWK